MHVAAVVYLSWYAGSSSVARTNATRIDVAAWRVRGHRRDRQQQRLRRPQLRGRRRARAARDPVRGIELQRCATPRSIARAKRCASRVLVGAAATAVGPRRRRARAGGASPPSSRRGASSIAREPLEELLAREQRRGVDPGLAAGPALDVRRREQVLSHAGRDERERHRGSPGVDLELAQRADDELDRALDQRAAVLGGPEGVATASSARSAALMS